ncbi:hypothetical protein FACS189425_06690 [Clostridia bacterium]|nr:hypothetical protein FACS189425_06690 [Clostridia bacterium]
MYELTTNTASVISTDRTAGVVTAEIRAIKWQTETFILNASIEMGRRLEELKGLITEDFTEYVKRELSFSRSTAYNLIKVFKEYGNAQGSLFGATAESETLGRLDYSKALLLLAVPSDEREEFVKENDVEDISVRELKQLLAERESEVENLIDKENFQLNRASSLEKSLSAALEEKNTLGRLNERQIKEVERLERQVSELKRQQEVVIDNSSEQESLVAKLAAAERQIEKLHQQSNNTAAPAKSPIDEFKWRAQNWKNVTEELLEFVKYIKCTEAEREKMFHALTNMMETALDEIKVA